MNTQRNLKSEFHANLALAVAPKITVGKHFAKPALKREPVRASFLSKLFRK